MFSQASKDCKTKKSTLAIIDNKSTIEILGQKINTILTSGFFRVFIGMRYVPDFLWNDGQQVDKSLWSRDFPDVMQGDELHCAALRLHSDEGWRLQQYRCWKLNLPSICERDRRKLCSLNSD